MRLLTISRLVVAAKQKKALCMCVPTRQPYHAKAVCFNALQ